MDKDIKKINNTMVSIFGLIGKLEEESIKDSSFENVSLTEVHTMVAIGTGRPKTMTSIAGVLGINVSTLTTSINKLVKKGYVTRGKDEHDRRIVRISLTDKGRRAIEEHEAFHSSIIDHSLEGITANEKKRMNRVLSAIERVLTTMASGYGKRGALEMKPLKIGPHTLPVPIVQAGMGIGIAGENLAAEVAINGGLGLIAITDAGFNEPDFETNRVEANIRAIKAKLSEARRRVAQAGGTGLVGVNIIWNLDNAQKYIDAAVRSGAQVIVTSAGLPRNLPEYCHDKKVALVPTISTRRAAETILASWSRKYNRLPDGLILQSPTAAGLLGYKEELLEDAIREWSMTIAEVKGVIKNTDMPLIAGGGIFDKNDAEMAYRCGADGFLMGSRFVATEECDAPDEYKQLYLKCGLNDVTIVNSPMKAAVRVMRNSFSSELAASGSDDYDIMEAVRKGIKGEYDNGLVFCSANPERITKIDKVADVFREFTS